MVKFRVKRISNIGIMTETFSTECVKESTAINRFTRVLSEYDNCFTESMLSAFMSLSPVGYSNGLLACRAIVCTGEYTLTVFNCGTEWIMLIEFKKTDSKEPDSKESDIKDTDIKDTDIKDTDIKDTDIKDTDSKDTDSKESDIKDTDIKDTDIKDTDIKDTDIKDTDSKDTDSKDTFSMKCEYFFSLSPKSPCKCSFCIYSKCDFCPVDVERCYRICEE